MTEPNQPVVNIPAAPVPTPPPAQTAPEPNSLEALFAELPDNKRADAIKLVSGLRSEAAENRVKLKEFEPIVQAAREAEEAQKTELQKAQERATALENQLGTYRNTVLDAQIRVAAAKDFNDPSDALAYLHPYKDQYLKEDGSVDGDKISDHLQQLLRDKPYLGVKRGPAPDVTQGSAGNGGATPLKPEQLLQQVINRQIRR